jgi:hypothetical protein
MAGVRPPFTLDDEMTEIEDVYRGVVARQPRPMRRQGSLGATRDR